MDLRRIDWKAGAYDEGELSNCSLATTRAPASCSSRSRQGRRPGAMRALGFCVSVRPRGATWPRPSTTPVSVRPRSSATPHARARRRLQDLRCGECRCSSPSMSSTRASTYRTSTPCCSCGPTESSTVFLQQLGRGSSSATDKAVLTALDFVGHHRKEFRFDRRYRATDGEHGRAGAGHRAWLPLPASRHADRAGPPELRNWCWRTSAARSPALEANHR